MKNSFYHVAQRFSIRKYSFGAASVLLGVFLPLQRLTTPHQFILHEPQLSRIFLLFIL